ncbi:hypothetical protein B6U84_04250, partial [Candidatus Bathyarchaeota archaeon ex4484_40]
MKRSVLASLTWRVLEILLWVNAVLRRHGARVAALTALLLLAASLYQFSTEASLLILEIEVFKDGLPQPNSLVYLFAYTPDGMRFLRGVRVDGRGLASLTLPFGDVIGEWVEANREGRFKCRGYPSIVVAALDQELRYGGVSAKPIETLSPQGIFYLRVRVNLTQGVPDANRTGGVSPLLDWDLIYAHEEWRRVNIAKLTTDAHSEGFFIVYIIESVMSKSAVFSWGLTFSFGHVWEINGPFNSMDTLTSKELLGVVDSNQVGYASMRLLFRFERWRLKGVEPPIYQYWFYIRDMDVCSLDTVQGEDNEMTGEWQFYKNYTGKGFDAEDILDIIWYDTVQGVDGKL